MFEGRSTNEKIVMGLIGIVLFAALVENAPALFVLLGIFALIYFTRENQEEQINERQTSRSREVAERPRPVRRERPRAAEQIHQHALRAVRRAGLDPDNVQVLTTDIGLITFSNDDDPSICRNLDIPDNADYIQPFIEVRVPVTARGRVKFEVFDGNGDRVFVHEDLHDLQRGRNLISPSGRMPIHDEVNAVGNWELRVTADGTVLSRHVFSWTSAEGSADRFNRHIGEDGEISNELRAIMVESQPGNMSLDELLAYQDDEDAQQQSR